MPGGFALLVVLGSLVASSLKVVREYERLVVFRLGRLVGARGPGLTLIVPGLEKAVCECYGVVKVEFDRLLSDIPRGDPFHALDKPSR